MGAIAAAAGLTAGLAGLTERAATVGGEVSYGPDGSGWRLTATLPMHGVR